MTAEGPKLALGAGGSVAGRDGWRVKTTWAPSGPLSGLDTYTADSWMEDPDFRAGDPSRTHLARLGECS